MKATGLNSFMARVDAAEYGLCCRLNRGAHRRVPRRVFQIASRLGDGVVWYALILALPVMVLWTLGLMQARAEGRIRAEEEE